ncbi:MAG TPA: fibronectin type III domain-containing protein [Solirubrobacteraceae bacterium]|nr:fibronectin type III domain-containing protein [Solirubrobacteraceae bacterium]
MWRFLTVVAAVTAMLGAAVPAHAAGPIELALPQGDAFSMLGHSCGGIQEQTYATGFEAAGLPTGDVYMQTRCGGSGRGGGYKTTTYSAWASVVWDWFGTTRSFGRLEGSAEQNTSFSETDAYGDRIYNVGTRAYLETGEPPLVAPAPPTEVTASAFAVEEASEQPPVWKLQVTWTPAPATASMITSSTVTATPVGSTAPVVSSTVTGSGATLGPLAYNTTYSITVTNTDDEGTSQPSAPVEVTTGNEDAGEGGEGGGETGSGEICEQNQGSIRLSPGLTETPHVQTITVKGELGSCDGPLNLEGARYTARLKTIGEVTCSALVSLSAEPTTESVFAVVKWLPFETGMAHGSLVLPITEVFGEGLRGTLSGGPFESAASVSASSVAESFTGGPTCGTTTGKRKAKAVKNGSFSTSPVLLEPAA